MKSIFFIGMGITLVAGLRLRDMANDLTDDLKRLYYTLDSVVDALRRSKAYAQNALKYDVSICVEIEETTAQMEQMMASSPQESPRLPIPSLRGTSLRGQVLQVQDTVRSIHNGLLQVQGTLRVKEATWDEIRIIWKARSKLLDLDTLPKGFKKGDVVYSLENLEGFLRVGDQGTVRGPASKGRIEVDFDWAGKWHMDPYDLSRTPPKWSTSRPDNPAPRVLERSPDQRQEPLEPPAERPATLVAKNRELADARETHSRLPSPNGKDPLEQLAPGMVPRARPRDIPEHQDLARESLEASDSEQLPLPTSSDTIEVPVESMVLPEEEESGKKLWWLLVPIGAFVVCLGISCSYFYKHKQDDLEATQSDGDDLECQIVPSETVNDDLLSMKRLS